VFRRVGKFALVALGIVLVAAAGAFFAGIPQAAGLAGAQPPEKGDNPEPPSPGLMYVLKERVVNLADPGARRYLKVSMSIEFSGTGQETKGMSAEERAKKQAEFEKSIAPQAPIIDDAIISILTAKSTADVASPEGKQQLRVEIKDALNKLLGSGRVSNVYFTQFVIQ